MCAVMAPLHGLWLMKRHSNTLVGVNIALPTALHVVIAYVHRAYVANVALLQDSYAFVTARRESNDIDQKWYDSICA